MKTVSFQGTQLTSGQRIRLQQQQHIKSFMHPFLAQQVSETLRIIELRKEQGVKPEQIWFFDYEKTGTVSVAEWMGF